MVDAWGSDGFSKKTNKMGVPLATPQAPRKSGFPGILSQFKASSLKAILASSYGNPYAKGTWNGCVFNQVTGQTTTATAASVLGEPRWLVSEFIGFWDSNKITTEELRGVVVRALADKENPADNPDAPLPGFTNKFGGRQVDNVVWESKFATDFEEMMLNEGPDSVVGAAELAILFADEGIYA